MEIQSDKAVEILEFMGFKSPASWPRARLEQFINQIFKASSLGDFNEAGPDLIGTVAEVYAAINSGEGVTIK